MTKTTYIKDVALLEQLPVFYQPWYLDIFDTNWDIFYFETEDGLWVFPFFRENKFFFKLSRPPIFTPYYGPYLLSRGVNKYIVKYNQVDVLTRLANQFSVFRITPEPLFDFSDLHSIGFSLIEKVTYVIDLSQSEDEMLAKVDSKVRRNLKKANTTVHILEGEFNVDLYYEWLMFTVKTRGDKLNISKEDVAKYVKVVIQNNAAIVNTAVNENKEIVGMNFCLYDNKKAYNILLVNNPNLKNNIASTALLWHSILTAKKMGCNVFDFEGSKIPGVADFFRRFGSERIDFFGLEKNNSMLWSLKRKIRK